MKYYIDVYFYRLGGSYRLSKVLYLMIIPQLNFTIDKQMDERLIASDGSAHGGYVGYIISFAWILWELNFILVATRE